MTQDGPMALFQWFANWFEERNLDPKVEVTLSAGEFSTLLGSDFLSRFVQPGPQSPSPVRWDGRKHIGTLMVGTRMLVDFYEKEQR